MGQNKSKATIIVSFDCENKPAFKELLEYLDGEGWKREGKDTAGAGKHKIKLVKWK